MKKYALLNTHWHLKEVKTRMLVCMSVVGLILVAVDFESLNRGLLLFLFLQLGHMMTDRQEALHICFVNQCVQ
jgi:hypothetical protein